MSGWPDVLNRVGGQFPGRPAVVADGESWTFSEVAGIGWSVSSALRELGVRQGARVVVVARNVPEYLFLALGVARAGAVLVPVNFRLAPAEIAAIARDCGAEVLAVDDDHLAMGAAVRDLVPALCTGLLLSGRSPSAEWLPFDELLATEPTHSEIPVADSELARVMYTSGTTGGAKGVEITHGMVTFNMWAQTHALDIQPRDRILVTAPFHHVGGMDLPGPAAWLNGATLVLQRRFAAEEAVALLRDQSITGATLVQTMLHRLAAFERSALRGLAVRWLQFGSLPASLVRSLQELLPGVVLIRGYGMTETLGGFCHNVIAGPEDEIDNVGHPLPFMEVRIVDDWGSSLPPGIEGDIEVRGPKVTSAYFGNVQATREAFREGWLRTGDIGRLDDRGRLTITDRRKDLIRSGSENISSQEVEEVLYRHEAVSEAAVVGRPDDHWGEVPVAFVVTSRDVSAAELTAHCRQHLAGFKVPRHYVVLPELPRTASGKVAKPSLRERLVS